MAEVRVESYEELKAALVPANQNATIKVSAGLYLIDGPLTVPDGATLEGEGRMQAIYAATGWWPGSQQSVLRASPGWTGDILTLGNGARIIGLTVEDVTARQGNLVAVYSRTPNDSVSAVIESCELLNPNPSSALPSGPIGRGLIVLSRNPNLGGSPPPHAGSKIDVLLARSIIRSPGNGSGIFAINFAPSSRIVLRLSRNRIGGGLDANGGVSRPDPVIGSQTTIFSDRNTYLSDGPETGANGWLLHGGSNAPIAALTTPYTNGNWLVLKSYRDSIQGFDVGINASGGWRPHASSGAVNFNRADLELALLGMNNKTADLVLSGAKSGFDPAGADPRFVPGDDNSLRVSFKVVWGSSGPTSVADPQMSTFDNVYRDAAWIDGSGLADPGNGNRLEVFGEPNSIHPAPGDEFSCGPAFTADEEVP